MLVCQLGLVTVVIVDVTFTPHPPHIPRLPPPPTPPTTPPPHPTVTTPPYYPHSTQACVTALLLPAWDLHATQLPHTPFLHILPWTITVQDIATVAFPACAAGPSTLPHSYPPHAVPAFVWLDPGHTTLLRTLLPAADPHPPTPPPAPPPPPPHTPPPTLHLASLLPPVGGA